MQREKSEGERKREFDRHIITVLKILDILDIHESNSLGANFYNVHNAFSHTLRRHSSGFRYHYSAL